MPYRHKPYKESKISVDKIVTLETGDGDTKIVKIGIEKVPDGSKSEQEMSEPLDNDVELDNTSDLDKSKENFEVTKLINELKSELQEVKLSQEFDR